MDNSANLSIPYLQASQAQKHVTHNEAIRALDCLVQLMVLDRNLTAPPATPADGDRYIVAAQATGIWSGQSHKIAAFADGHWTYHQPKTGWVAYVDDEDCLLVWKDGVWTNALADTVVAGLSKLGVNASADLINRLAVKSDAVLFDASSTGSQVKINKAAANHTSSLLFQSGYTGHAEIGLVGNNALRIKISADGVTWKEVLATDPISGQPIIDRMRPGRSQLINVLPDSGRFNGNNGNTAFDGISYVAPSYLSALGGAAITSHGKFIHNNSDYGGSAGTMNADVRELADKIMPTSGRRYGAEWYVIKVTNGASVPLVEERNHAGIAYGLAFGTATTKMPGNYTVGYYAKVKSGSALLAADRTIRTSVDGVPVPTGSGATPVVFDGSSGWKHVNLETAPNSSGYDYRMLQLQLSAAGEVLLAMPKLVFGHADLNPDLGILMNSRLFG